MLESDYPYVACRENLTLPSPVSLEREVKAYCETEIKDRQDKHPWRLTKKKKEKKCPSPTRVYTSLHPLSFSSSNSLLAKDKKNFYFIFFIFFLLITFSWVVVSNA